MHTQLATTTCPYCGEPIELVVDPSVDQQQYVEDCEVCCQPIELTVSVSADEVIVTAGRDDD